MGINQKIVSRRMEKGYSTTKLAKLAGIAQSTLREIEIGNTSPTWDTIEKISKALEISPIQLVSDLSSEISFSQLSPDLLQLIESAKKLPPEERKALNEYLKVRLSYMDKTTYDEISATKESLTLVAEPKSDYVPEAKKGVVYEIPLVGASAAGIPMIAIGYHEGNFEVPEDWGDFALRVQGDSMEPLIPDKGFVFVRQQEKVYNNEIALVKILSEDESGEEVTIKRVRHRGEKVQLLSENPQYEPMEYDWLDIKILGKVVKWLSAEEGNKYLKEYM